MVRRDLRAISFAGSPARGYDARKLIEHISELFDQKQPAGIALVGVAALGRAVIKYCAREHPEPPIVAALDTAADKVGRIIDGCPCHHIAECESILRQHQVTVAILTVPAEAAQEVTDLLVHAGIRGILNFTGVRLRVPPTVFVEDVDIAASLEKVIFFARPESKQLKALE